MNIGIDFGSTYSLVSRFREDHQGLEVLEDNGSAVIPSVLSVSQWGDIDFGNYAKQLTGTPDTKTYMAFKMLLTETDKTKLADRGYDETHTPEWASEHFLNRLITRATNTFGREPIENIVIGAPDNWFNSFDTSGGKNLLEKISTSLNGVDDHSVRIISEPVLASTYFAYNFQKQTQQPFEGVILIVDYGGGTLDLSISEIRSGTGNSVEVRNVGSRGTGENTDHSIGKAGIVYMESLMEYVIRKNSSEEEAEQVIGTQEFYKAVNILEQELKYRHGTGEIKDNYGGETAVLDYPDDFSDVFLKRQIRCGNESYRVSYEDMLVVYNNEIRDVFDQTMDSIIEDATRAGIDVYQANGDQFKIALVGGFGNFWLVHKQMQEKFEFTHNDDRERYIIVNEQDRERAISYGASLVASGAYNICSTAPYSVGIRSKCDGQTVTEYMVNHFDEIELNRPYYIKETNGDRKVFLLGDDWTDELVIDESRKGETDSDSSSLRYMMKDSIRKKLQGIVNNPYGTCGIGISFTESDVLNLHIIEYLCEKECFADAETVVALGQIKECFEELV